MTLVRFRLRVPTATGEGPASGSIVCTPLRRRHLETPDRVIVPAPFAAVLDGAGEADVELAATGPSWAWQIRESVPAGITRWVSVPDVDSVDYGDLTDVDPETLDPAGLQGPAGPAGVTSVTVCALDYGSPSEISLVDGLLALGLPAGVPGQSVYPHQRRTLTDDTVLTVDPAWPTEQAVCLIVTQDEVGGHLLTMGGGIVSRGVLIDVDPGGITVLVLVCVATGVWWAYQAGRFGSSSDVTPPTWSATLTTGTPTDTSVVISASALAADETALSGYRWRLASESELIARPIVPSGLNFTLTGLTASTTYSEIHLWALDVAGNRSADLVSAGFATDDPPPSWQTIHYDSFTDVDGTLIASHTPDVGASWTVEGGACESRIASGAVYSKWTGTNYVAQDLKFPTANADFKLRASADYSALGRDFELGFKTNRPDGGETLGVRIGASLAINTNGTRAEVVETSGITTLAPQSGTAAFTLDGNTAWLHIDGVLYRQWNITWSGGGTVLNGAYLHPGATESGGDGLTLVSSHRVEWWR